MKAVSASAPPTNLSERCKSSRGKLPLNLAEKCKLALCLETSKDFSVNFCTCSIRIFFSSGCHFTFTSSRCGIKEHGHTFQGGIHILSWVSTLATMVAWKLRGEFALHPERNFSWERCLLDYAFKSKPSWPIRSHHHLAMLVTRCESWLIYGNLGDLSCLSHEEESRSLKSFGRLLKKVFALSPIWKNLSNFEDAQISFVSFTSR